MKQCGRIGKKLINKEKIVQIFDETSYTNPLPERIYKKGNYKNSRCWGKREKQLEHSFRVAQRFVSLNFEPLLNFVKKTKQ